MGHDHNHAPPKGTKTSTILFALFFNLGFAILELFGGLFVNSSAILSNALHDFGDSLSLLFALIMEKLSQKKRDSNFSYGYKRFSTLAAFINSAILITGAVFILAHAIPRLMQPQQPNSLGMLIFAIVGISVNLISVYFIKRGGNSLNERVVMWHLLDDVLGWGAVFIVSIAMLIWDVPILDPILSIVLTLYLLWNVLKLLKESGKVFMQGIPASVNLETIEADLKSIQDVVGVHDSHAWSLDGEQVIFTTHVIVNKKLTDKRICDIKEEARHKLEHQGVGHATIEIEREGEKCHLDAC